ncbi:MAG: nuclear transport factor 2 family protein [Acidimicrobiia bacterium]|nr:nuclear transport factor 2 family protein [Acidimicrobiia bacterium]
MRDALVSWVLGYVHAWNSNDPVDIGRLFSEDARYFRRPLGEPWSGRQAIVDGWVAHRDKPGTWSFQFEILGVDGDVGFIQGRTEYRDESNYANLFVVRLNEAGECTEFTEWFMADPESVS